MADQKIKAQPKPQPALKKEEAKILPEILPKTREEILEEVEEGKLFIATEGKPTFIPKGYEAIELRLDEDVEPYPFLLEEKVLLYDSKRDIISSMDNVCRCFMEISKNSEKESLDSISSSTCSNSCSLWVDSAGSLLMQGS